MATDSKVPPAALRFSMLQMRAVLLLPWTIPDFSVQNTHHRKWLSQITDAQGTEIQVQHGYEVLSGQNPRHKYPDH